MQSTSKPPWLDPDTDLDMDKALAAHNYSTPEYRSAYKRLAKQNCREVYDACRRILIFKQVWIDRSVPAGYKQPFTYLARLLASATTLQQDLAGRGVMKTGMTAADWIAPPPEILEMSSDADIEESLIEFRVLGSADKITETTRTVGAFPIYVIEPDLFRSLLQTDPIKSSPEEIRQMASAVLGSGGALFLLPTAESRKYQDGGAIDGFFLMEDDHGKVGCIYSSYASGADWAFALGRYGGSESEQTPDLRLPFHIQDIALNVLSYLTAFPDDAVDTVYPQQFRSGSGFSSPKATAYPVRAIGGKFRTKREGKPEHVGTHASPITHWRRGHWRNHAIGKGRSQRKLIWLQPTLVAGRKQPPAADRS